MEELRETLEEMGFKGIAPEHLELFAKGLFLNFIYRSNQNIILLCKIDLKRLMKHEQHVKKKEGTAQKLPPVTSASLPV